MNSAITETVSDNTSLMSKAFDAFKNTPMDLSKLNGGEMVVTLGLGGLVLLAIATMANGYELEWSGEYGGASARIFLRKGK